MSRVFTDENLLTWEAFTSGGEFGLPDNPKIVFQCLSDPGRRGRFVLVEGDESDAQEAMYDATEDRLRAMLSGSRELD